MLPNYSTNPNSNGSMPGINMATGAPPSSVHPGVRQIMADLATWYANAEWLVQADAPSYVSASQFTVPANRAAVYSVNRRVQAVGTGYTINGTITASAFTSLTTVTVTWDSGALDATLAQVAVGILQSSLQNVPLDGVPIGQTTPAAGSFTTLKTQGQAVAPFAFRNCLINGAILLDQYNNGASVTLTAATTFVSNRFRCNPTQAGKLSSQQVVDAPAGFKNSLKFSVLAQYAPLATDQFYVMQPIEGLNVIGMAFGTASPSAVTLSFWVKGSVAGTYSVAILNGAANRSYVGTYTVTNSWAQQVVTLTADNTGTWATDNTMSVQVIFDLGSGSNFNGVSGSWLGATTLRTAGSVALVNQVNGSTINLTGIQFERGNVATTFEFRDYGDVLRQCQRYYYDPANAATNAIGPGMALSATGARIGIALPVPMRAAPTLGAVANPGNLQVMQASTALVAITGLALVDAGASIVTVDATGASGLVAGNATRMYCNNANVKIPVSAEL